MEINKKSKGQIEDMISKKAIRFYLNTLGTGPKEAKTYILEDMVIVRLQGRLLPIEQKLLQSQIGLHLVKDIRQTLHALTTGELMHIISDITNHKIISTHSDISTKTGEIVEIFVLDSNFEDELNFKKLSSL